MRRTVRGLRFPTQVQRLRAIKHSINRPLCQGEAVSHGQLLRLESIVRVAPERFLRLFCGPTTQLHRNPPRLLTTGVRTM